MRLIDADSLIESLDKDGMMTTVGYAVAVGIVKSAPSIDAVPVVRCRECIYRVKLTAECTNNGGVWGDDEYCSDGKRREGGDT